MATVSRPRRLLALLTIASLVAAVLVAIPVATAGAGAGDPRDDYPAKLSVTGSLTITTTHDTTGPCVVGQAWTIEATADVNISGRIELERIGDRIVQSTAAQTAGGAVDRNTLSGFHETNLCEEPAEQDPPPKCSTAKGTGTATINPDIDGKAPWDVGIGIGRISGPEQDLSCQGWFVNRARPDGTQLEALQSDVEAIVLPLDLSVKDFAHLRVNKKLKSKVKISGPCEGASAKASAGVADSCVVSGSFAVVVQRLPGAGRGVSIARVQ
jgi:hypothetical protein